MANKKIFSVALDSDVIEALAIQAAKEDRSRNYMINIMLRNTLGLPKKRNETIQERDERLQIKMDGIK